MMTGMSARAADRLIDIHTHVFPDAIAERAVAQLTGRSGETAFTDGTVSGLKRSMDAAGIQRSVIQPVSTKAKQVDNINRFSEALRDDPRIEPFGTLFPGGGGLRGEAKRLRDAGVKGIKLHPDYQVFFVDEESAFPLYEAAVEAGLIVLFHAGVDIGLGPPYHCTPERLARVMDRFPGMRVVAAHFGGFRMWDQVEEFLVGRDLCLDTSYTLDYLPAERFVRMARAHGIERVLFGTDSPWADQSHEVEQIRHSGLSAAELQAVCHDNAARLLELTPDS